MTYMEIIDEIDAYNRRRESDMKDELRNNAAFIYKLGELIGIAFNDPKSYPKSAQEAFPKVFETQANGPIDWQMHKADFRAYAAIFNRQREAAGK